VARSTFNRRHWFVAAFVMAALPEYSLSSYGFVVAICFFVPGLKHYRLRKQRLVEESQFLLEEKWAIPLTDSTPRASSADGYGQSKPVRLVTFLGSHNLRENPANFGIPVSAKVLLKGRITA
jgi:hypothetical protein